MSLLRRRSTPRLSGEDAAPSYTPKLAARGIHGHLLVTDNEVQAWYVLHPKRWSFRSDSQRNDLIRAVAGQYAELQGRWLHLRVTGQPVQVADWARAHLDNARNIPPDSPHPGAVSFDDYLIGEQQQLSGRSMADKVVYVGVQVQTRRPLDRAIERAAPLLRRVLPEASSAELVALDAEIEHLDTVMAGSGLAGQPATAAQMQWLLHRSCALGLPAPDGLPVTTGEWDTEDLASFADAAEMYQEPYAPAVTVRGTTGSVAGQRRQVAVLTLGQMLDLAVPEADEPWSQRADRMNVEIEQSARIYVRRPEEVNGELQRQMNKVRSQVRHFTEEHGLEAPTSLERQHERVRQIDDEMTSGFTALATRVKCWWRFAVSAPPAGSGEAEQDRMVLRAAQQMVDLYKPKIGIEHPEAQHKLAREFIPGEPQAAGAHARRFDVKTLAAAMPQATAEVGDRRGVLLGETCTATRRPVVWDPWMSQEVRDSSGLTAIVGGLGSGKSFLSGGLVYKTIRSGASWTLLDPSGPLSKLCDIPELRPYARSIDLLNAEPGILNPYRVVADPRREDFADDDDPDAAWHRECSQAAADRRQLVQDLFVGILPHEVARLPETRIVLVRAVRAVDSGAHASPADVIDYLRHDDTEHHDHARIVADFLDEMRPRLSLLIPDADADPYELDRDDRLTVLSMAGLTLPKDGVDREHWNETEALGVQLLNLAAWLTQRSVYRRGKTERKGVAIDEAFFLSNVSSGRVLMNRFARDSRKWNVRVLLSSQIPQDFLRIEGFASLVDSVFVGRLDDDERVQSDALDLLKVPTGAGYEPVLSGLSRHNGNQRDQSPRQFLFADGAGGVEKIRADFSGPHLEHLRQALDTTPVTSEQTTTASPTTLRLSGALPAPASPQEDVA